uniref:Uncharacterized protein n=1 Tax=Arundo donax TaxID=35708 RepID=A0A0A9H9R6_ARUDO
MFKKQQTSPVSIARVLFTIYKFHTDRPLILISQLVYPHGNLLLPSRTQAKKFNITDKFQNYQLMSRNYCTKQYAGNHIILH